MNTDVHTVIVGAGVVGAGVAYALRRQCVDVFLVEKEDRSGQGISGRNSGVIHAGLYYPKNSLKFRLCRAGNSALYEFARQHGVTALRCGKFLVANTPQEVQHLHWLARHAGSEVLHRSDRWPSGIRANAALFSPSTGIIDVHGLVEALIQASGAEVLFRQHVTAIRPEADAVALTINDERVTAKTVINCAGLDAAGLCPPFRHYLARGSYFQVRHEALNGLESLVYPAIPKDSPFLGIHLTRNVWGEWLLGPDFEWVSERRYDVPEEKCDRFIAAARTYLPWLAADHLQPAYSGIRPRLSRTASRDFTFARKGRRGQVIHCLGIESPGLTACIAIGRYVRDLLESGT